jgi:hypothetical protein
VGRRIRQRDLGVVWWCTTLFLSAPRSDFSAVIFSLRPTKKGLDFVTLASRACSLSRQPWLASRKTLNLNHAQWRGINSSLPPCALFSLSLSRTQLSSFSRRLHNELLPANPAQPQAHAHVMQKTPRVKCSKMLFKMRCAPGIPQHLHTNLCAAPVYAAARRCYTANADVKINFKVGAWKSIACVIYLGAVRAVLKQITCGNIFGTFRDIHF